jgi:hypothetical protein
MSREEIYGTSLSISLEPIPENFGYSLGSYSHLERCRAPDRKKSTKRRGIEAGDKEQVDGHEV